MTPLEIFGLQFIMSVLVVSLIAKFYAAPWLAQKSTNDALIILLVSHAMIFARLLKKGD